MCDATQPFLGSLRIYRIFSREAWVWPAKVSGCRRACPERAAPQILNAYITKSQAVIRRHDKREVTKESYVERMVIKPSGHFHVARGP